MQKPFLMNVASASVCKSLNMQGIPEVIQIDNDNFKIGRNPSTCDVAFDSPAKPNLMSRIHAQICLKDGGTEWFIKDLGSTNGTFLNGVLIEEARLSDRDEIVFGGGYRLSTGTEIITENSELKFQFFLGSNRKRSHDISINQLNTLASNLEEPSDTRRRKLSSNTITTTTTSKSEHTDDSERRHYDILRMERIKAVKAEEAMKKATDQLQRVQAEGAALEERRHILEEKLLKMESEKKTQVISKAVRDEITCIICHDILLRATLSKCQHVFCESCITSWRKRSKTCPLCRKPIGRGFPIRVPILDNTIEKLLPDLPEEERRSYIRRKEEESS